MRFPLLPLSCSIALLAFPAFAAEIEGGTPSTGLKAPERVAEPHLHPASNEWKQAMTRFRVAPNFKLDLFAAEPLLGNPVAFDIDHQGRFFVAETHRYRTSTLDIRHYMFMLEDDLACRTTGDRVAMLKKHFPAEWQKLGLETEVIRLVEDRDGDGKADFSSAYASGMNTLLDGINSGVLARDGDVWCTNMPSLLRFSGTTADGKAAKTETLSSGYGVRFSFTGHDMHGLIVGPDGRLYFSFGDRGASVRTKEGRSLEFPDEGAVFRCEQDGSNLEVVARGLRNPQELAFDKFGNLFTGDNDSDQGDRERWVFVVPGADCGWRIGWQHNPLSKEHNPWLAEKMWEMPAPEKKQPAYVLPPVALLPDGPSGLTYYPGTGLPAKFDGHFFLCGFKGSSARSAVSSWALKPQGAGFELIDQEVFIGDVQATDITFGPDSRMYFSEWGEGWEGTGRGRIFTMWDPEAQALPQVAEVRALLKAGFAQRPTAELGKLLGHGDQRVRLEAQWALAKKEGGAEELTRATRVGDGQKTLARIHGVWGLGHTARLQPAASATILQPLLALLADDDEEVRAQAACVLGDTLGSLKNLPIAPGDATLAASRPAAPAAVAALLPLLADPAPRVSFHAALALGKLGAREAAAPLVAMVRRNADADLYLRHAGAIALAATRDEKAIAAAAQDNDRPVRLAALLAMRRLESPAIAGFLHDKESTLVTEAARAINDVPIAPALPQLAALLSQPLTDGPLLLRSINANARLGSASAAEALAAFAQRADAPEYARLEAIRALATWPAPITRDRIVGTYRPQAGRDAAPAVAALRGILSRLLADRSAPVVMAALGAVEGLKLRGEGAGLLTLLRDVKADSKARVRALKLLALSDESELAEALKFAVADKNPALRLEASALLAKTDPDEAARQLAAAFPEASLADKKSIIGSLGGIAGAAADQALATLAAGLAGGKIPAEVQLELIEAAAKRPGTGATAQLAIYQPGGASAAQPLLAGGDKANGEKLFKEHAVAQCFRCHKVGGSGGEAGPDLTGIGGKKDRRYLLDSILNPNAQIAEGFQMTLVTTKNGDMVAGLVRSDNDKEIVLQIPGAEAQRVAKTDVAARDNAPSGMPANIPDLLTRREIRDIVEYVASLK